MTLYSLGFLSRYNPEIWNPFTRNDITGEKLFIEKFLYHARRLLPNLILNRLYNEKLYFVTEQMGFIDLTSSTSKEEITEITRQEIREHLDSGRK